MPSCTRGRQRSLRAGKKEGKPTSLANVSPAQAPQNATAPNTSALLHPRFASSTHHCSAVHASP